MELDSAVTRVLTQAAKIVDAMPVELAAARRKSMNNRVGALQAERGFVAAVNEVSANDYAVGLRDWKERRALVNGWLARVAEEGRDIIRDGVVSAGDATDAAKRRRLWAAVDAELHGSSEWETIMSDIEQMMSWWAQRTLESTRKHRLIGESLSSVGKIVGRYEKRMYGLGEASKRINRETRRILDLDEATQPISVADWLKIHGRSGE